MKGYPKWFSAGLITMLMSFLILTGYLLAPTTLELRLQWHLPWRLTAEDRIWMAALHALGAFIIFSLMGALWSLHMRQEWRRKKSRWSGAGMVISLMLLGLTGLGIYYFGNEQLSKLSSLSHLVIGIIVSVIYFAHAYLLKPRPEAD